MVPHESQSRTCTLTFALACALACALVFALLPACNRESKGVSPDPEASRACPPCPACAGSSGASGAVIPLDLKGGAYSPPSEGAGGSSAIETVAHVGIDSIGAITFNGLPVPVDAELRRLAKESLALGTARFVVGADAAVTYSRVIHVLDLLKMSGVSKIALSVGKPASGLP